MKIRKALFVLMISGICMSIVTAASQDRRSFYVGGSFSLYDSTILDHFTRYMGGSIIEKNTFEEEYTGLAYGFYFGYKLVDKKRVFINVEVHGNFFSNEFNLETSNSTMRRNLFCTRGIDFQSGYNVMENLFFFVNFSVERGRFQFSKDGTTTDYDVDIPVMGSGFGMGAGYNIFPFLTVRLKYQFNQYGKTEISSSAGEFGRKIDVIELLPRYDNVLLSVQYNFGNK
ncbi:hypothetical protein ACFLRW_01140 [Acidobacteriota bacterium]